MNKEGKIAVFMGILLFGVLAILLLDLGNAAVSLSWETVPNSHGSMLKSGDTKCTGFQGFGKSTGCDNPSDCCVGTKIGSGFSVVDEFDIGPSSKLRVSQISVDDAVVVEINGVEVFRAGGVMVGTVKENDANGKLVTDGSKATGCYNIPNTRKALNPPIELQGDFSGNNHVKIYGCANGATTISDHWVQIEYLSVGESPPPATPSIGSNTPIGSIDGISCGYYDSNGEEVLSSIGGWAIDRDCVDCQIFVHVYADKPADGSTLGTWVNYGRADNADEGLGPIYGGTAEIGHRYNVDIPNSFQDGQAHSYYVYGISVNPSGEMDGQNFPGLPPFDAVSNQPGTPGDPFVKTCTIPSPPPATTCGDGNLDAGEVCEVSQFESAIGSCDSGFVGNKTCGRDCQYNNTNCIAPPPGHCGLLPGLEPGEQCEPKNSILPSSFTTANCIDIDKYTGGVLRCTSNCILDASGCTGYQAATCNNNGVVDSGEMCDGSNFTLLSCQKLGFQSGNLQCNNCQLSTAGCQAYLEQLLWVDYNNPNRAVSNVSNGNNVTLYYSDPSPGTETVKFNIYRVKDDGSIESIGDVLSASRDSSGVARAIWKATPVGKNYFFKITKGSNAQLGATSNYLEVLSSIAPTITGCKQFTTQTTCNAVDSSNELRNAGEPQYALCTNNPNLYKNCKCVWVGSPTSGVCRFSSQWYGSSTGGTPPQLCQTDSRAVGSCSEGEQEYDIYPVGGSTSNPNCPTERVTLPCGIEIAELPGFGEMQFIAALLAVAVIYLGLTIRKR